MRTEIDLPPVSRGSGIDEEASRGSVIGRTLALAREHVCMDAAFLSEFVNGDQVFREVEGHASAFDLRSGGSIPFADSYCRRVLEEEPKGIVRHARMDNRVRDLLLTHVSGIGAYVGVPVRLPDGRVYGTLFCLSRAPKPDLGVADVRFMELVARVVAEELARIDEVVRSQEGKRRRIARLLERGRGFSIAFQPVFDLRTGAPTGVEALSRFDDPPPNPERWFTEAAEVGLGLDLELAAVEMALAAMDGLPAPLSIALNVSPEAVISPRLREVLSGWPSERIILEVTEHARIDDYVTISGAIDVLRGEGLRVAVDDVGAGFASLRHVLRLRPDILKLDITLTSGIDSDPVRRALAASFIGFASEIEANIVAEGIETRGELECLRGLGVAFGQGYHLARPGPLADVIAAA